MYIYCYTSVSTDLTPSTNLAPMCVMDDGCGLELCKGSHTFLSQANKDFIDYTQIIVDQTRKLAVLTLRDMTV